jgi:hypothetical protein
MLHQNGILQSSTSELESNNGSNIVVVWRSGLEPKSNDSSNICPPTQYIAAVQRNGLHGSKAVKKSCPKKLTKKFTNFGMLNYICSVLAKIY